MACALVVVVATEERKNKESQRKEEAIYFTASLNSLTRYAPHTTTGPDLVLGIWRVVCIYHYVIRA